MTLDVRRSRLRDASWTEAVALLREWAPALSLRDRFVLIHEAGIYAGESASGDASSRDETREIRPVLPSLLADCQARSLLDVPCGDFHWMREVPLGDVRYVGADIVPAIVERNRRLYGAADRQFLEIDVTRETPPRADLILCRDLLTHLSNRDALRVLGRLRASGSGYLLTTHFPGTDRNLEIESGDFRTVDLCAPPFLMPPPLRLISEDTRLGGPALASRSLALWRVEDLPAGPAPV